jgi:maleylacetate reductase
VSGGQIRFGAGALAELPALLGDLALERPVVVTSRRGTALADHVPAVGVFDGVRRHAPMQTVEAAVAQARAERADAVVALGGGSALDTAKAVSAALDIPVVAVPTTYAGAEWTSYFGMRDEASGRKGGGTGARTLAAVYDPELTLSLPRDETGGTAMNALAHCAEAFYALGRSPGADGHAFAGARAIARALPRVLEQPEDLEARTHLLAGALRAALALAAGGLALGHALAQACGGRYGLPHGALNAVCLPAALRYNAPVVPAAVARLAEALEANDAPTRMEELARLGGYTSLRELGVPADELDEVGALAAARPGSRANPRPVTSEDAAELLRSVW